MSHSLLNATCLAIGGITASLMLSMPAAHADVVHTDTSLVRACLPISNAGDVIAATDGGVFAADRDGMKRIWTSIDGLAGTRTFTILREGNTLWLGGERGLTKTTLRGGELFVEAAYKAKPVRAIARHDDSLYVGTWNGGVMRLSAGKLRNVAMTPRNGGQKSGHYKGKPHKMALRITDLAVHDGTLIASTAGRGMFALTGNQMKPMALAKLDRAMVWTLASHEGTLWAGTVTGLYAIRSSTRRPQHLVSGDIRDLHVVDNRLVAATFGGGIALVRDAELERIPGVPVSAQFDYGYARKHGTACIASHRGLWIHAPNANEWTQVHTNGPPSGDIATMVADGDRVWVGTFDRGLAVYENRRWKHIQHRRIDPKINALAIADGKLWIGTSAGLSIMSGLSRDTIKGNERVTRIGKRDGLPSNFIMALEPLRGGGVVVGTAKGAAVIRGDSIRVIGRKQGVYVSNVWSVHEEGDGTLLLGTTKGLYRVRADGSWERFSVASGHLTDDWVMAIEMYDDTWWIGTYKGGVTKFKPSSTKPGAFDVTHLGGGFINPSGLTWERGTLYAATMDGMLVGDGGTWQRTERPTPGRDTTMVVKQASAGFDRLWISGRRGLRARSLARTGESRTTR